MASEDNSTIVVASPSCKRFGPDNVKKTAIRKVLTQISEDILNDVELQNAMKVFPKNYNFEIPKTIWRVKKAEAKCVALQFPEGLQMFALTIADIVEKFTGAETIIMGDVTYGACCVDDFTAHSLGADFLVHYGHSCLVPIDITTNIGMLYVFVDIRIDCIHFIETVNYNFEPGTRITLVSTIQFVNSVHAVVPELQKKFKVTVPQSKPLSPGEILGCTAPLLKDCDVIIYLGDGRFHLEAIMIANPSLAAYRYDPYTHRFTKETYDISSMIELRKNSIKKAETAGTFGLILGTIGRQGNPKVLQHLQEKFTELKKDYITVLLSEIFPDKLRSFSGIDAWIQIACPRLSIDWGHAFSQPLLTPYEAAVVTKQIEWQKEYPMDFYAYYSKGKWTPSHRSVTEKVKSCRTFTKVSA